MYPGFSFHDTPLGSIVCIELYDNSVEPSQYELTTRGCAMVSLSAVDLWEGTEGCAGWVGVVV